jgi:UDP-3-O-[3-hydroxymyristoyl] glucosamine N-acyltransferase
MHQAGTVATDDKHPGDDVLLADVVLGNVIVTAKSGVSKSLLKPGMYTSAFPAVNHADWNKSAALLRNIDKLRDRIKALENAASAGKPAGAASNSAGDEA